MLIAIISPPLIPISRIREVVFPPAPPTPITLIRAACFFRISSSSLSISEFMFWENGIVFVSPLSMMSSMC